MKLRWYQIDEDREISDFITCAEYQLFIDEMRIQKKEFHQPAHWTDCRFPKGSALQPILGIRGEDAHIFCEWLNRLQTTDGSEKMRTNNSPFFNYRLPTLAENMKHFPTSVNFANWCLDDKFLLHWFNPSQEVQIKKQCETLSKLPILLSHNSYNIDYTLYIADIFRLATKESTKIKQELNISKKINSIFNIACDINIDLDLNDSISSALETIYELIVDLISSYCFSDPKIPIHIQDLFEDKNYLFVQQAINKELKIKYNIRLIFIIHLLDILITKEKNRNNMFFSAWRNYAIMLSKYIYENYSILEKEKNYCWQFWKKNDYSQEKEAILSLHWWLLITNARMEGKLPTWEGLRIVREKKFD